MPKMTDQEFDNLFRQAANRISPEPPPGDWDDMQRRLESAERDARARNISLYSILVLLLLYSFVVPDTLKYGGSSQASVVPQVDRVENLSATESPGARENKFDEKGKIAVGATESAGATSETANSVIAAASDETVPESPSGNGKNEAASLDRGNDAQVVQSASGVSTSGKSGQPTSVANIEKNGPEEPTRNNSSKIKDHSIEQKAVAIGQSGAQITGGQTAGNVFSDAENAGAKNRNAEVRSLESSSSRSGSVDGRSIESGVPHEDTGINSDHASNNSLETKAMYLTRGNSAAYMMYGNISEKAPSTAPLAADPEERPATVELKPPPGTVVAKQTTRVHPLFVRLLVSPDFSSIDYGKSGETGLNFGPMVEYGLSPRFSISTGAIWSKKLYYQDNPEKIYGQGGGYPLRANSLNGDCRIIDIPLNVTYYMLPGRKTNLFVTVGSSSYIMLKEDYVYTVTHNYRDYEYEETYSNENNEWFSMLNVSFGIQHQVAKRWFVQGEPFLKAPMKGVGAGKVNLVSAGVFVSVKYWINP